MQMAEKKFKLAREAVPIWKNPINSSLCWQKHYGKIVGLDLLSQALEEYSSQYIAPRVLLCNIAHRFGTLLVLFCLVYY